MSQAEWGKKGLFWTDSSHPSSSNGWALSFTDLQPDLTGFSFPGVQSICLFRPFVNFIYLTMPTSLHARTHKHKHRHTYTHTRSLCHGGLFLFFFCSCQTLSVSLWPLHNGCLMWLMSVAHVLILLPPNPPTPPLAAFTLSPSHPSSQPQLNSAPLWMNYTTPAEQVEWRRQWTVGSGEEYL